MNRSWRVVFRGPVSDEVLANLPSDQMIFATGHETSGQRSAALWVWAADAAAAKEAVRDAISTPGTVGEPEPLPYSMWVGIPEEEADAVELAIAQLPMQTRFAGGADFSGVVRKEPSDGFAELMIAVPGRDRGRSSATRSRIVSGSSNGGRPSAGGAALLLSPATMAWPAAAQTAVSAPHPSRACVRPHPAW
jgi:hypothetical protein